MDWISVKDRLPSEDGEYLTYNADDIGSDNFYYCDDFANGRWVTDLNGTISHWMPLPSPPKE